MVILMHAWLTSVTKFKAKTNVYKILNINKTLRESRPIYAQFFFLQLVHIISKSNSKLVILQGPSWIMLRYLRLFTQRLIRLVVH